MKRIDPKQFIQYARAVPADTRVPLAFEKRIVARLRERGDVDPWLAWSRALWKAAVPAVGFTVVIAAISLNLRQPEPEELLARDFEEAVLAPMQLDEEAW